MKGENYKELEGKLNPNLPDLSTGVIENASL
jgi:hypothetical protein